jgi:hypothetical protein
VTARHPDQSCDAATGVHVAVKLIGGPAEAIVSVSVASALAPVIVCETV